ncbi:MAG: HRDC domain-containing protein [Actinomycetaceae bacterium]|nr:HRDC domain-containing protein [Actinomycetaceae bacterium]MDY6083282.1 HRDC domain-containing protein [Actinomycetaceae bacterium]
MIFLHEPAEGIPPLTGAADIDTMVNTLAAGHGPFSLDTERARSFRYSSRAYLIQIRREGSGTFLLDPVGNEERLQPLASLLTTDEWILHAADQDLPSLRELGLSPATIFDTEIAGALLGLDHIGLQAEVEHVLGIHLDKEETQSDWSARPLTRAQKAYAALDVELLLPLRNALAAQLDQRGRLEWLRQECDYIRDQPPREQKPNPWVHTARQEHLSKPRSIAMFQALWQARDDEGKRLDIAPEKILPSRMLAKLANRQPRSLSDISNSPLLASGHRKDHAQAYWDAIKDIWKIRFVDLPHTLPRPPRPEPLVDDAVKRWNIVRPAILAHASRLGIQQEYLLKPTIQRKVSIVGWEENHLQDVLLHLGARPWQAEQADIAITQYSGA